MEYNYSPEQLGYIQRSTSNLSAKIRDILPFHSDSEFAQLMRMPVLKFLNLVDLLQDHECFDDWTYSDVMLHVAACVHRLGNGGPWQDTASTFDVSVKRANDITGQVIQIIIKRLANLVSLPETTCDPDGPFDGEFDTRVGFLGAGSVWLGMESKYVRQAFCSFDRAAYGKYSIRVIAAIAPSLKFLNFFTGCSGSTPFERVMELSPLFQKQETLLNGCQYLLTDNAPKGSKHLVAPYLEDQYVHDLAERIETTPRRRSATFAVNRAFWMWKCMFRSLNGLPLCIESERSLSSAKEWIKAAVYLYNFLHPNIAYVQWLVQLDKEARLRELGSKQEKMNLNRAIYGAEQHAC